MLQINTCPEITSNVFTFSGGGGGEVRGVGVEGRVTSLPSEPVLDPYTLGP